MREKVRQNPDMTKALPSTGDLVLKPDHHEEPNARAAWRHCDILMAIRAELRQGPGGGPVAWPSGVMPPGGDREG